MKQTNQTTEKKGASHKKVTKAPVRLWVKSCFLGFRRSQRNQNMNQALLKISKVNDK